MRSRIAVLEDDDELEVTTEPIRRSGRIRFSRPRQQQLAGFLGVPWWGWVLGAAGVGGVVAFILTRTKEINLMLSKPVDAAQVDAFYEALPSGVDAYAQQILSAALTFEVNPWALAGIMHRESKGGTAFGYRPDGPTGTGDWTARASSHPYFKYADPNTGLPPDGLGWGRGLMQIDFGVWNAWVTGNAWWDAQTNINKGAEILASNMHYFQSGAGGGVSVAGWRLSGSQFTDGWTSKYGLQSTGPFPDPRPLSGALLLDAAIAAYNGGTGGVLQAIAAGLPPSAATAGGDYSTWVATRAEGWAQDFA